MKRTFILIFSAIALLQSCASQIYMEPQELNTAIQSDEFSFVAKRANPTNYAVINTINSIPNSTATRILELSTGYGLSLKKNLLEVNLPYFGRAYKASTNPLEIGYRFASKDFYLKKSAGKNGKTIYTFEPNDNTAIRRISIEIYPSGSAMVSVDSNDRQPITYDGYLEKFKK